MFRRRFSSLPMEIEVTTTPLGDGRATGTLERIGSRWIFGRTRTTVPLLAEVTVVKSFWDTFFSIYVTPDIPVSIRVPTTTMRSRAVIWGLAAAVIGAAIAMAAFAALR